MTQIILTYFSLNKFVHQHPHTPRSMVEALDQSTWSMINIDLDPLHVSTKHQHPLQTPEI
jgi:hypothetical protein